MDERVMLAIDGHVADVRLNRPEKLNALDGAMFDALIEVGDRLRSEPGVRAVVLSGEGRAFCAGLDFGSFMGMAGVAPPGAAGQRRRGQGPSGATGMAGVAPPGAAGQRRGQRPSGATGMAGDDGGPEGRLGATEGRMTHRAQQAAWCWQEVPVPVIAALHGAVYGGGLQIALATDIRIVAPDARLSVAEVRWGLIPDMTGTVTLTRLMGVDVAKELALTGRAVDGEEAVRIGLGTRLADDPRAAATDLAHQIAGRSPHATRAIKRLLNRAARQDPVDVADQFAAERAAISDLIGSSNQVEAVRAYLEKREPVFED